MRCYDSSGPQHFREHAPNDASDDQYRPRLSPFSKEVLGYRTYCRASAKPSAKPTAALVCRAKPKG